MDQISNLRALDVLGAAATWKAFEIDGEPAAAASSGMATIGWAAVDSWLAVSSKRA